MVRTNVGSAGTRLRWLLAGLALSLVVAVGANNGAIYFDTVNGRVGLNVVTPLTAVHLSGVMRYEYPGMAVASGMVLTASGTAGDAIWKAAAGGSDNLGNHTATMPLNLANFALTGATKITGLGDICIGSACP